MTNKLMVGGVVAVVAAALNVQAGWYAGGELGYITHTFKPKYSYAAGVNDEYTDYAYGAAVGARGGYRLFFHPQLAVAAQARVAANNARWKLDVVDWFPQANRGGAASLEAEIPYAYNLSLAPELYFTTNLAVYGEVGIGHGYVRAVKNSDASTSYSYERWTPAYSYGGGLRYQVRAPWNVFVEYRATQYDDFSYTSRFPDGTEWEYVDETAYSQEFLVGATYFF